MVRFSKYRIIDDVSGSNGAISDTLTTDALFGSNKPAGRSRLVPPLRLHPRLLRLCSVLYSNQVLLRLSWQYSACMLTIHLPTFRSHRTARVRPTRVIIFLEFLASALTTSLGAGLRAAIDPHQIPSPIEVVEADREIWEGKAFMTLPGSHVPLSTTDFIAFDQGARPHAIHPSAPFAKDCNSNRQLFSQVHPCLDLERSQYI